MSVKENIENKIMANLEDALDLISTWKRNKEKIVFTNGCFDLFHAGHAHSLADAAKYGTKLIVGLNDDSSVHKLKGKNRPFNKLRSRAFVLASLQAVDLVIPFSELNPEKIIQTIIPNVLAKGSDYALEDIVGASFVLENKGEVVRIPLLPDISSTRMADFMLKKNDQDAN